MQSSCVARPSPGRWAASLVLITVVAALVSCAPAPPELPTTTIPIEVSFRVLGGVEQIYVIGATEGDHLSVSLDGQVVGSGTVDRLGSLVFRGLVQGRTYVVTDDATGARREVKVLAADEHPPSGFYSATAMHEGLNYIPMRDGITLAATVRPPIGQTMADGPFPTVIEYSGYQIAAPNEPIVNKIATLLGLPKDPLAPTSETDVGSLLIRLGGFAVVSVQLRGTGCSGGESDLFDLPSRLDGYDVVETVAAQPWVSNGMVGMVGISFSGFSQIATASTRPPHLAAIAPLSFVGSLYDLAHPGGIFNNGFAKTWVAERAASARPAPDPGALAYANVLVQSDKDCAYNQLLRLQTRDADTLVRQIDTNTDEFPRRDFRAFMGQIDVPTFASLQFDDEETSGYAILSAQDLLDANDKVWLNLSNGHHRDAVTTDTITQLFEFLDIYVARRTPEIKFLIYLLNPLIFGDGSATPPLPTTFIGALDQARAEFEARPRVRLLLELPRGMAEGSSPGVRYRYSTSSFPIPGSTERTWYLGEGGSLSDSAGDDGSADYRPDPGARPTTSFDDAAQAMHWTGVPDGNGVGFITEPLTSDVVALGPAAASIDLSSTAPDTDLGLVLSEVRPDGQEMLVSTGTQRASMRTVDADRSTPTRPAFTNLERVPLPSGMSTVPVQILPAGHIFRAGSRIRLSIAAVGGERERWAYESIDPVGGATVDTVHFGDAAPSSLTLTLAPLTGYPSQPLPCPTSAKPCRPYLPATNGG